MENDLTKENKKLRDELRECKKQIRMLREYEKRVKSVVGDNELLNWRPNRQSEEQYGWIHAWLSPLDRLLANNLNLPLTPDIRNKIHDLVVSIIGQLAIIGKYGVKVTIDTLPIDQDQFSKRQMQIFEEKYDPCDICGETRITHECHIIPRSEGGQYHRDNLVTLCPLHHHLFDHLRLTKEEKAKLLKVVKTKSPSSLSYFLEIRN